MLAVAPRVRLARGIDLTAEMLRQAREFQAQRRITNVAFDCGEAEQLPYPDATFDLVSCQMSLHHMSKPGLVLKEMIRVAKPDGRLVLMDALSPEIDSKFDLHNRIERSRDPSHTLSLRLTSFLEMFEENGLEISKQAVRRRQRSFHDWMLRAGSKRGDKRYLETRKLLEDSISSDGAGYTALLQGDDILIIHNEGMFLLRKGEGTYGGGQGKVDGRQ